MLYAECADGTRLTLGLYESNDEFSERIRACGGLAGKKSRENPVFQGETAVDRDTRYQDLKNQTAEAPRVQRLDGLAMQVQDLAANVCGARDRLQGIVTRLFGAKPEQDGVNGKIHPQPGKIGEISDHVGYLLGVSNEIHALLDELNGV